MLWLIKIVGLMIISALTYLWLKMRRSRRYLSGLPSYPMLPILGNVLQMPVDPKGVFCLVKDMTERSEAAMKPFVFSLPGSSFLLLTNPEDVKAVTTSYLEKPFHYKLAQSWLGDGLVTAPGAIWKKNIKKISGAFTAPVIEDFQGIFNAQGRKLVSKLKERVGEKPFNVLDTLALSTFEAICQTALGEQDTSNMVTQTYYEAFNRTIELLLLRGANPLLHPDFIYRHTKNYQEYNQCIDVLKSVSTKVYNKKIVNGEMKQNKEESVDTEGRRFKPFIDTLLEMAAEDPTISKEYIQSEMSTIIVGGQETTATTLFFTLLMVGCQPEVQRKLYEEVKSVLGDTNRPIETADLKKMVYCEAVVCETLRLFPAIPVVIRYADRDLQIKSCTIPEGTLVLINAWGAGRSQRSWGPTATLYRPERWLEGRCESAAFLPFSYGRRSCIGKKYAISILKTLLAYCVRELEFTSEAEKLDFKVDIALRPVSGHLIEIKLRDK